MVSSQSFDNTGNTYNVSRVINDNATFNPNAYKAYSPMFISITFAMSYGLAFASISSTFTHTLIYYREQDLSDARSSLAERHDVHTCLMSVYKGIPDW